MLIVYDSVVLIPNTELMQGMPGMSTAPPSRAFEPSLYTVSVGNATKPTARMILDARSTEAASLVCKTQRFAYVVYEPTCSARTRPGSAVGRSAVGLGGRNALS